MKAYWDALSEREQWMLGSAGVFCIVCLLYLLLYAPLLHAVHHKKVELIEKQETENGARSE